MHRDKKQSAIVLIVDIFAIILGYLVAQYLKFDYIYGVNIDVTAWMPMIVMITLELIIYVTKVKDSNFCSRKIWEEFESVLKLLFILEIGTVLIMFFIVGGHRMSRAFFVYQTIFVGVFMFLFRIAIKNYLVHRFYKTASSKHLVIVTTSSLVGEIKEKFGDKHKLWEYKIAGWILIDEPNDKIGELIDGHPVIGNYENMYQCVTRSAVDEVFIHVPYTKGTHVARAVEEYEAMGIKVHLYLNLFDLELQYRKKELGMFGGFPVISFAQTVIKPEMVIVKRIMDIAGALVGLLITAVATIFVAPPLLIESPGPLFFAQKRVGTNGRPFKIYKFRSMYMDAEERKKELMEQNQMSGLMFKMENDPRITRVGKFIRKFSIDELPQFWNVLIGDMSLVGTRPPTMDEFLQYENRYKRRLSFKPGITGMWQASGRSDIKDFEEVVRLDLEYIDNWSVLLDIKILFKTVYVAVTGKGAE